MKPADEPQVHVAPNASVPGLVVLAIGSGSDPYSVAPEFAIRVAAQLLDAAITARSTAGT